MEGGEGKETNAIYLLEGVQVCFCQQPVEGITMGAAKLRLDDIRSTDGVLTMPPRRSEPGRIRVELKPEPTGN